jgi:murein L,D-transpeptidase YafK
MALGLLGGCAGKQPPVDTGAADTPLPTYQPQQSNLNAEQQYIAQLLNRNGFNGNGKKPTVILIHKLTRKLTLYQGTTPIKTYRVVLGADPLNDKLCQGDTCTPEGVFRVLAKYPHARWSRFILIDYPNTQNWLRFGRAKQAGRLPPDADIGGEVGIHGTEDPLKNLSGQNWTRGCVSLLNQDVEELYSYVNEQTLVVIKRN